MSLIPKKSKLVKNAEEISGNKRDMRKKLVKSNTKQSDLKRPITKRAQGGLASFIEVEDHPTAVTPTGFSEYSFPLSNTYIDIKQKDQPIEFEEENTISSKYVPLSNKSPQLGNNSFDKILNEVSSNNPSVKNLRKFLIDTARTESNFDFNVQNKAGAPAYGAFQFMDFNIKPLGVSVEQFRNNPKLQIEAAANLANQFKSQFTEGDKRLAKKMGYNENALLAGAWLGGVGGVRKVLRGEGNPSDKHWSKEGEGTTVKDRMNKFNKLQKGGIVKPTFEEYYKTVPLQKGDTTNYNLKRAYELAPYKDMVRFAKEPDFHLNSVYKDLKTGIYNFVKSRNHPTVQLELDWYNSPEGMGFKNQYDLDATGEYYKYIPKKQKRFQKGGVLKCGDGKKVDPAILEYWKRQNVVLPSPKNEQVSSDSRTRELRNYQETQQQINQNLEKGKHLNFWTQPYANFSGRQATELGTNLFKQSLYTGVGDVAGTYALAGLGKVISKLTKVHTPNYTGNHLKLTKSRLRNGMANKLAKNTKKESGLDKKSRLDKKSNSLDIGDEFDREYILNKQPEINAYSADYGLTPESLGVSSQLRLSKDGSIGYFTGLFKDSKALVDDAAKANNIIEPHEFSHLAYRPTKSPKGITTSNPYFTQFKGAEQTARGTQIKNYFGISDTSPITKKMWKYAKKNYVKDTGMDNSMTEWFNSVTNSKDYLKWLNKHTPAIIPAIGGTATYLNNNDN